MKDSTKHPSEAPMATPVSHAATYDEERVPFDQVLRKLVSTRPAHKAAGPVKRNASKPPKKA